MSGIYEFLRQIMAPAAAPEPPRPPAGKVTPILRTELPDVTDPGYLGNLVTSSEVTEADIDRTVFQALLAQAEQDEIIEEGGRLIGLRVSEVRPTGPQQPTAPAPAPSGVVPHG